MIFVLPIAKMDTVWKSLSRSGGQIKFHIQKIKSEFMLLIPGNESVNITKYLKNYKRLS